MPESFGPWLRQQRELRGISLGWLAARIKLSHERVEAIEEYGLAPDGQGRATARALASVIGADPEEAVALLGARGPGAAPLGRASLGLRLPLPLRALSILLLAVAAVWLLAELLLRGQEANTDAGAPVVYRPDYVQRLLGEPDADPPGNPSRRPRASDPEAETPN